MREARKARSDTGSSLFARARRKFDEPAWRSGNIPLDPEFVSIFRTFAGGRRARGVANPHQRETLLTAD
jgi:hypothetical protein